MLGLHYREVSQKKRMKAKNYWLADAMSAVDLVENGSADFRGSVVSL